MGKICRRNSFFFFAGLISLVGVAAIIFGFIDEGWATSELERAIKNYTLAKNNKTLTFGAGWKKFGLLKGCKKMTYAISLDSDRRDCYEVFKEFDGVFNLKIIYAVVGCLSVGAIVLLFCAVLSFYNEFTKSSYVILGSAGLYIVNGVAFFFMFTGVCLFAGLYHQQIRKNVLTDGELKEGFSSDGKASLNFSFWIVVASCFLPLINMVLTFLNSARAKSYFNRNTTIPTSNVDGMMLY